jgi:ATP phosphoribosyltransferase regulatory subunit
MNNQKYLLPIGFYDLLNDEAKINQESIDILLKKFYDFGYNLIKTPLIEFEESLGGNYKLAAQSFKMVDMFTGKNLVARSDITAQITRLLNTRLKKEILPIRLCYAGDVLKVKNDDLYSDRQLTQVGIELIGANSQYANQEVINVILEGLNNINLPNLMIDFCLPQFLNSLLIELKIKDSENLAAAIAEKNISQIKKLAGKYAESLTKLTLEISDFDIINKELAKLPISKSSLEKITNLQKIVKNIKDNYSIKISVNIFGDSDFFYHQDIGFTIFEEGFSYPIARGGRYEIGDAGINRISENSDSKDKNSLSKIAASKISISKIPAIGATIYINNLRKILVKTPKKYKKTILLPANCGLEKITQLQKQGYVTLSFLDEKKIAPKQFLLEAKKMGCNFAYNNKEIQRVS